MYGAGAACSRRGASHPTPNAPAVATEAVRHHASHVRSAAIFHVQRGVCVRGLRDALRHSPILAGPGAVEHGRDGLIGHLPRQHGDEGHHMGIDAPAMLADAVPRHAQGRVVAALPSNDKAERVVLDTNDNLLDQRADDPFAGCWRGAWAMPGPLEISAEREQAIPVRGGQRRLGT